MPRRRTTCWRFRRGPSSRGSGKLEKWKSGKVSCKSACVLRNLLLPLFHFSTFPLLPVMRPAITAVFFLSGASALIFETLWFRGAGLAFGNSIWASSLVLSGFMAGLALGNGLAARLGARLRHPIRAYAIAEAVIALTGVGLVYLFPV